MIKIVEETFDRSTWNAKAPHPLQSWEWGEARAKMNIEVVKIAQFEKNTLKNTYQLTLHTLPFGYKIGYLPRSKTPTKEMLKFLSDFGKMNKVVFFKLEPYEKFSDFDIRASNLKPSPHPLFPEWTIILDLIKTEEELFKSLKSKTRYNIRLAQKKGVVIKEKTDSKGFEIFQKLYFETCKRQNYYGHNYAYHKAIFDTLKSKVAHILIAFYQDKPLCAYELFLFNNKLYYIYGGSSEKDKNVMAPNLLMWETIRFGKKHEAGIFDMWNSLPPGYDANHPWAGFTRFKEGYGGEFIHLSPSHDLVINPVLYSLYNKAYFLRLLLLKLKS